MTDQDQVAQIVRFLDRISIGDKADAKAKFAVAWLDGEHRANHLAGLCGISRPTASRWRKLLRDEFIPTLSVPENPRRVSKQEAIELVDDLLRDAREQGRVQDVATLLDRKGKLERAFYEPERSEQTVFSVSATVKLGGTEALLREVQELAKSLPAEAVQAIMGHSVESGISLPGSGSIQENPSQGSGAERALPRHLEVPQTGPQGHIGGQSGDEQVEE